MDAIELLKKDHQTVRDLFKKLENTSETAIKTRESILLKLREELDLHTAIEEKLFYPSLKEEDTTEDLTYEAYEEHDLVKYELQGLAGDGPGSKEWNAKVKVLKELVEHHVKEEETELFPKVKKAMSKEWLAATGEKIAQAKAQGKAKAQSREKTQDKEKAKSKTKTK